MTALIVPQLDILKKWCEQQEIHWTSPQYMIHNIKVVALVQSEIDHLNNELPNFKRVRNFVLAYEEWTVESGEMTTSFKPVRKVLLDKFGKEIEKMYSPAVAN